MRENRRQRSRERAVQSLACLAAALTPTAMNSDVHIDSVALRVRDSHVWRVPVSVESDLDVPICVDPEMVMDLIGPEGIVDPVDPVEYPRKNVIYESQNQSIISITFVRNK